MTILMTADTLGGVWTYAVDLIRALQADNNGHGDGVAVHLATLGAPLSNEQRAQIAQLPNATLHASDFALEWMPNPWEQVRDSGQWLLELERDVRPDIVHLNGYAHAQQPFRAPKLVVAHSDVLSWWRAVHNCDAPQEWRDYQREVEAGLRAADLIVAPTRAVLDGMRPHYEFSTPTRVIFNGRDASGFAPQRKEPFIFAAGRLWDEAKNLALLDAVAPRLAWPVYVAGPKEKPGGGEISAPNVTLLGQLSEAEVRDWMGRASIYCLPAKYEPFGLSILEAGLCGCALVVNRIPSLWEVWRGAARSEPFQGRENLTLALQELIARPEHVAHYGHAAQVRAQDFSIERSARKYKALYRELSAAHRQKLRRAVA